MRWQIPLLFFLLPPVLGTAPAASADAFAFDGYLEDRDRPAEGPFDFRFRLYSSPDEGRSTQIGPELERDGVVVRQGHFTVFLDFGAGTGYRSRAWLEIEVASANRLGGFTRLEGRQPLSAGSGSGPDENVPVGTVVFFNLASCPTGWSEFAPAQGRTLVGLQPGGTLGGTQGTPLTDLEQRVHQHWFHYSTTTSAVPDHGHQWAQVWAVSGGVQWTSFDQYGSTVLAFAWGDGIGNDGSGVYPLAAQPDLALYTSTAGGHSHEVEIPLTLTTADGAPLPYLQLLACQKD